MNNEEIINEMIDFVKKEERQMQARKLIGESKSKNDIIEKTLKQLDQLVKQNQE